MKKLIFMLCVLCVSPALNAAVKCEIRGHLIDKKNNKPFSGGFRFEDRKRNMIEYVTTDKNGLFIIYVKDTGTYYFEYNVGYCTDEREEIVITESTTYNITIDFQVLTWDRNCIADEMLRKPQLVPRLAFMQGWRAMIDGSVALRLKPRKKNAYQSHSIAIGAEWNYGFKRYLFGCKIGYTYLNECFDFSGITVGVNAVYFADRSYAGWYAQPQIAFEGLEVFEIIAQYNLPLTSPEIDYRVNQFSAGLRFWFKD